MHGAIYLNGQTMCEDCGAKQATFGLPDGPKRRWCSGCGKGHGAVARDVAYLARSSGQTVEALAQKTKKIKTEATQATLTEEAKGPDEAKATALDIAEARQLIEAAVKREPNE